MYNTELSDIIWKIITTLINSSITLSTPLRRWGKLNQSWLIKRKKKKKNYFFLTPSFYSTKKWYRSWLNYVKLPGCNVLYVGEWCLRLKGIFLLSTCDVLFSVVLVLWFFLSWITSVLEYCGKEIFWMVSSGKGIIGCWRDDWNV